MIRVLLKFGAGISVAFRGAKGDNVTLIDSPVLTGSVACSPAVAALPTRGRGEESRNFGDTFLVLSAKSFRRPTTAAEAPFMDSPQAEQDVVGGLRDGRPEAWRALYDAYARRVWQTVARQMGPGAADVGDVVQETFLAAARSARQFDASRGSPWMWLCGIARRQVALHYRNQRRHDRLRLETRELAVAGREAVRWLEDSAPGPGEMAMQGELAGLVRTVLAELPLDYEMLLTAKYFDGLSIDELAVQEGCSATAVRSKLARARRAFRDAFCKRVNP